MVANLDPLGIVRHKKLVTKSGMTLNANEEVLLQNSKFFKGKHGYIIDFVIDLFAKLRLKSNLFTFGTLQLGGREYNNISNYKSIKRFKISIFLNFCNKSIK